MNKLLMVAALLLGSILMLSGGAGATTTNLQSGRPAAPAVPQLTVAAPPTQDSLRGWWNRSKKALHQLSACALGSAGLSYALIVGVALPGPATLGLIGAGIMVLMCL